MSDLKSAFRYGKALLPFIICSDPDLATTAACVRAAAENGADLIELGIPFSDPTGEAEGFLYIVSGSGAAETGRDIKFDFASIVEAVRRNTDIPCVTDSGISMPEQEKRAADFSDGVIDSLAVVRLLEQYGKDAPEYVGTYVRAMKEAMGR